MIIDGKSIASQIQKDIASEISKFSGRRPPCLAVIITGNHQASQLYVNNKIKACTAVGIRSIKKELPNSVSEQELINEINLLNENKEVDGILVQLPLPPQISVDKINMAISPKKDVDGFNPLNMGKLLLGDRSGFQPCTPLGIKVLLEKSGIETVGKHVVIAGRSNIVGKPIAVMLMQSFWGNATVTVIHSKTQNFAHYCSEADILITAMGQPRMIKADMVKQGAVVIDVGINRVEGVITGDVDFEEVQKKCSYITPVPGGVGPMTIAMLLHNTLKSYTS